MKQRGFRYCSACKSKLQKRGLTAAGSQRWFCSYCSNSAIKPREDLSRVFVLDRFVTWLLGKQSQTELSIPDRTWRAQISWCWDIIPKPVITGEVYDVILIDGIRVGSMVCLIARTSTFVSYRSGTRP